VKYIEVGDLHDPAYSNGTTLTVDFSENYFDPNLTSQVEGHCQVFLDVHSSAKFEESYNSDLPVVFTSAVAVMFAVMAGLFFLYDRFVQNRNNKVVGHAARSTAIVSSLFPKDIQERLMAEESANQGRSYKDSPLNGTTTSTEDQGGSLSAGISGKPIADLFPEVTLMFGDIVGFT